MADIFLSYNRDDQAVAKRFAEGFEAAGFSVWWDATLRSGEAYDKVTEEALKTAKAVVVLWSKKSVESRWVRAEATMANRHNTLVPVRIEPCDLPIMFELTHTADLSNWSGKSSDSAWQTFLADVRQFVEKEAPTDNPSQPRATPTNRKSANNRKGLFAVVAIGIAIIIGIALYIGQPFNAGKPDASGQAAVQTNGMAKSPEMQPEVSQVEAASIAVLPFADMSANKDQEYFADGMAEEILNVLARVDGLKVTSRTSSFAFKLQPELGAPAIARELGVRHILEGSVKKAGDTVRITVQLVDTDQDQHLWSETFDRPLTTRNLFAIQDEVAGAVVKVLREKISSTVGDVLPAPKRTENVDAYGLFLEARALYQARRDFVTADRLLEEATRIDPKFADALAIRAAMHLFGEHYGADFGDARATRDQARSFARQALDIDANNSPAIAVMALTELFEHVDGRGERPFAEIFTELDRAHALDSNNGDALHWKSLAYNYAGYIETATDMQRQCIEDYPSIAICRMVLANLLLSVHKHKEAEVVINTAVKEGVIAVSPVLLTALVELNRRDVFLFIANTVPALRGWQKFDALYQAMRDPGGDHEALAAELKALLVANKAGSSTYALLNAIGDYDRPLHLVGLHWMDIMRPYRLSPEFKHHMQASGVVDYWREYGFPPQCRPIGADDFECD